MNTVGKILVILNFLFAIIVGALLVVDVALRNQWKEAFLNLKREADIMKVARDQDNNVQKKLAADLAGEKLKNQDVQQKIKDKEVEFAVLEDRYKLELAEKEDKIKGAETTLAQTLKAKDRLTQEITLLTTTLKEREALVVKLEADIKTYRIVAQNFEAKYRDGLTRTENLLEQNQALSKRIALLESGVNPNTIVVRNPNDPNPPAVLVNGKVEKVDGGDLIQISLGTDQGVHKNHTLDVYRITPEPKYLGMVRIVDANFRTSVGRLVVSGNRAFRPQLKTGDLVTSKLTR
ncbi:MAG: hypothetical protein HYX68_12250 [Planctomycetes bacterium]|nr:hypothetical protein [Planctomycetota bacterium]